MECTYCRKYLKNKIHIKVSCVGKSGNDLNTNRFCYTNCLKEWGKKNLKKFLE